jgi:Ca2+-binding EF-hand superfamily protein
VDASGNDRLIHIIFLILLASQSEGNPDIHDQRKLREHFSEDYDINKDGKLDKDELKEWLVPTRASAMRGTRKILTLADKDGDGHLSMKEIIENDRSLHPLLHDTNAYKDEL